MEYLSDVLKNEYDYEVRTFCPKEYSEGNGLSELDVLKAHYILSDYFIKKKEEVRYGILSFSMLSSAVGRQYVEYDGVKKWKDDYHKIASLLYGLTLDHAFHDGNKRTALLSALWYLNKCKREVKEETVWMLEDLVVRIASHNYEGLNGFKRFQDQEDGEICFIAEKLRNWTRFIDTKLYTVTFQELNTRLKQYDFYLDKPLGNHIGVYRKDKRSLFRNSTRVGVIGFPGWKCQVSTKDLHNVLKMTGLDSEHGIDSAVFFKDATPSYDLLQKYYQPLKRLKDS